MATFLVQILTISSSKNDLFVENWHFFCVFFLNFAMDGCSENSTEKLPFEKTEACGSSRGCINPLE